jgi:hypothetical protein
MKNAKIVALCVLVIALGLAFETLITRYGPPVRYAVLTESGQTLPSLFDGVPRLATIKNIAMKGALSTPNCPKNAASASVWSKIKAAFQPRAVLAQGCGSGGSCAGSYFGDNPVPCGGGACTDQLYDLPAAEGSNFPCEGYQVTGASDCGGCVCQEQTCNSCL